MFGKVMISVAVAAALFSASGRLPAATCILTNTVSEKACKADCCANKECCATSQKRTGSPVEPLAKPTLNPQLLATPEAISTSWVPVPIKRPAQFVFPPESVADSTPRTVLLCTFLI
jgi:hypothetical protein